MRDTYVTNMCDQMEETEQMFRIRMRDMLKNEKPNVNNRSSDSNCDVDVSCNSETEFNLLSPCKISPNNSIDCMENRHLTNDRIPTTGVTGFANVRNLTPGKRKRKSLQRQASCNISCRYVKALHLHDSPATPRTLIEKSTMHTLLPSKACSSPLEKFKSCNDQDKRFTANVNPFTPDNILRTRTRRRIRTRIRPKLNFSCLLDMETSKLDLADSEDSKIEPGRKRVTLENSNISRYHQEFYELSLLGNGEFSSVYKCINRLDGCMYSIKKSIKPIKDSINERNALKEVYAHAVLGEHQNVVRYFSAWAEDNRMIIQNEYCDGGSLADMIANMQKQKEHLSEPKLRQLLLHVVEGLKYIHSKQLVHLDIKPGSIYISKERWLNPDYADDDFDEKESTEKITYKVGDLSHVTSISNPQVEKGNCRYMSTEILYGDFARLPKADIFALGLTVYEAGGGGPLPENGPAWQEIREGNLKNLPQYSFDLNDLLKLMIHPDLNTRPSAMYLIQQRVLSIFEHKTKTQLQRELNAEKFKNEMLSKQLQQAAKYLRTTAINVAVNNTKNTQSYIFRPTSIPSRTVDRKIDRKDSIKNPRDLSALNSQINEERNKK